MSGRWRWGEFAKRDAAGGDSREEAFKISFLFGGEVGTRGARSNPESRGDDGGN